MCEWCVWSSVRLWEISIAIVCLFTIDACVWFWLLLLNYYSTPEERIIVTIDCRLRFVCREVEVCYLVIVVVVCVQSVLAHTWAARRVFPRDGIWRTRAAHALHVFIYVCVLFINPKCVQLVVRNVCLQSKFFFLNYSGEFNRLKPKTGLNEMLLLLIVAVCLVVFQRKRNVSTRDVAVFFLMSHFAVAVVVVCCCSFNLLLVIPV